MNAGKMPLVCVLLFCLLLVSCTGEISSISEPHFSADSTTSSDIIVVLEDQSPVFIADYEQYGADIAKVFYEIRMNGDPDWYEHALSYENGQDILFTLGDTSYSVSDSTWTFRISEISEKLIVEDYHNNVNLECKTEHGWQRLGVLQWTHRHKRAPEAITGFVPGKEFSIPVDSVYPEVSPGQYRFLVYVAVWNGKNLEYRQYYIPFEVVE